MKKTIINGRLKFILLPALLSIAGAPVETS